MRANRNLSTTNFGGNRGPKAWKDIWGSGQGIGAVDQVEPVGIRVERMRREYDAARGRLRLAA